MKEFQTKLKILNKLQVRCLIVFILSLVSDVIACWHLKSLIANQIFISSFTVFLLYMFPFLYHRWFVEMVENHHQFWLTFWSGMGAGIGTAIVIYFS